jgi:lactate permease
MDTFIALLPILLLLFTMVVLEKPAFVAAPFTLAVTSALALLFWQMDLSWFNASLVLGSLISLEIVFIVVGAFLLITVLKKGNAFSHIKYGVSLISSDVRIQAILLAWFFVSFVEGVSGFGTPAMIVAPLMVVMAIHPLHLS